ncbi:MAG TPA: hypothetical protein VLL54_11720 [Pyrinomonadaceae bacterium]|nr:hypothetical protein [Pyrinomonadaceae bacterium]
MEAKNHSDDSQVRGLIVAAFQCVSLILLLVTIAVVTAMAAPKQKKSPVTKPTTQRVNRAKSMKAEVPRTNDPAIILEPAPADPQVENADISITAHVRARSLTFAVVPNPTVVFSGQPNRDTVWEANRENLPTPVQPGVTYRDIGIRLKITSVFRDIDRIVAEALGEIPANTETTNAVPASTTTSGPAKNSAAGATTQTKPLVREKP